MRFLFGVLFWYAVWLARIVALLVGAAIVVIVIYAMVI